MERNVDTGALMHELRAGVMGAGTDAAVGDAFEDIAGISDAAELACERTIVSHRPIIGRVYVLLRRWIYREVRFSMDSFLEKQREVNRALIGVVLAQQEEIRRLRERLDAQGTGGSGGTMRDEHRD